ncbi:MAG: hypothetical protein IJA11_08635 [Oscillospiraceae bacterium]|nr:hypothetical protein [Oscillospiraceae bacterium]
MSNPKDNRIKQLEEQVKDLQTECKALHNTCTRQRDSLAAQQETIVQLNISIDSTLACLAEKYGFPKENEDGTTAKALSISTEAYPGVLDRLDVRAVIEDGNYVITVAPKPREDANAETV